MTAGISSWGTRFIVTLSVLLSAFVDNVPFLAAMASCAVQMSDKLQINPSLFLFGLLVGASIGGYTRRSSVANIVACFLF
jgi:Na+/H+ antiporter NhaD/arsenite permease-like protein